MKNNNSKSLKCRDCNSQVDNVGHDAVQVICSVCVSNALQSFDSNIINIEDDEDV